MGSKLIDKLKIQDNDITLKHILENSKADSGGERDLNFLYYLGDSNLLLLQKTVVKRKTVGFPEEYYLERYKKMRFESDRHFLCRTIIQEELKNLGIGTLSDISLGDMNILRSNSNYDIVFEDFSAAVDIGLTPARNYFRGLTDTTVQYFLVSTYFDDYMDDIIFSVFSRADDKSFVDAVRDYEEGFKQYIPNPDVYYDRNMDTERPL